MDVIDQIKDISIQWGADFNGVADLSLAQDAILEQGGPVIAAYPRAISLGIALLHSIVDQLPNREERSVSILYRHHSYDVINQRLDFIASQVSSALQRQGYRALPIPASKRTDVARICGPFSHKIAAHLAGLGWIGKNCLLVTPEVGPRVRWATVLTDAPLAPTGQPLEQRCGGCNQCVDICPVSAFSGQPFCPTQPREVRFNASQCDRYLNALKEREPEGGVCGMCLYVCPYGKN